MSKLTPAERLKQISEYMADGFYVDNPNGSDVNDDIEWLVERVKKLEEALKSISKGQDCSSYSCDCHSCARKALVKEMMGD